MKKIKPEIAAKLEDLEEKFKNSGQDLGAYLDGLLYGKYLSYWDYISLDTLLSLQEPETDFPDEKIFIGYHQITELYFKLVIHEQEQILEKSDLSASFFTEKLIRIIRYFRILTESFDVMIRGMEKEQFLKFRKALFPASGFQSAQFRMIEIYSTPLRNLVPRALRQEQSLSQSTEQAFEEIYWRKGATNPATGEKTLTLKQFEAKYSFKLLNLSKKVREKTIWDRYNSLSEENKNNKALIDALRNLDVSVNINWLLVHIGAPQKYLVHKDSTVAQGTGGTNWKDFLPPSFQQISFFPELWSEEERKDWGKHWVEETFNVK